MKRVAAHCTVPDGRAEVPRWPRVLAGFALFAACFHFGPLYAAGPEANQALPDVTFPTFQDETVRTNDLKGDVLFVELWAQPTVKPAPRCASRPNG